MLKFEALDSQNPTQTTLEAIALLVREVGLKREGGRAPTPNDIATSLEIIRHHKATVYGLLGEENQVLGAARVSHGRAEEDDEEIHTIIWQMAVRPDRRGEGLGRMIMHNIARAAITHNDTHISLSSQDDEADGFYARFGFVPIDEITLASTPTTILAS